MSLRQVVFITSLERSGSTLMDLLVGGQSKFASFGEVWRVLVRDREGLEFDRTRECTCGMAVADCPFWGTLVTRLIDASGLTMADRYSLFLSAVADYFGPGCVPIDSSKMLQALDVVAGVKDVEVKALFLIRDVRAWTVSVKDADTRHRELTVSSILRSEVRRNHLKAYVRHVFLRAIPTFHFWEWYLRNRRIQRFLRKRGIAYLELSYEDLALQTESTLKTVFEFLGVDPLAASATATPPHVVRGNRMRLDWAKTQQVQYDKRWLDRGGWQLPALIYPHIMRYNKKMVHEHGHS